MCMTIILKIIVMLLSRNKKRAKKRRKFGISWLLSTIQTPDQLLRLLRKNTDF